MEIEKTTSTSKKADWARYAEACDLCLAEAHETKFVRQAKKTFWKAVGTASALFIPAAFDTSN